MFTKREEEAVRNAINQRLDSLRHDDESLYDSKEWFLIERESLLSAKKKLEVK